MASVDPYAPCPCGSGQKFKWCCHKVEPIADKAERLLEGGQLEAALATLDEGLKKAPANPWLATRKAMVLLRDRRTSESRELLREVLAAHPQHTGCWTLLVQAETLEQGPKAGAAVLQEALERVDPAAHPRLAAAAGFLGMLALRLQLLPPARAHLELAIGLLGDHSSEYGRSLETALDSLLGNATASIWARNPYVLSDPPNSLAGELRERFLAATELAEQGRWAAAASRFEALSGEGVPEAHRNLGLCRVWLFDSEPAAQAFRRYVEAVGETIEAVDIEGLRQELAPLDDEDMVETVQLIWTLRDREGLRNRLDQSDRTWETGKVPLDLDDPQSVEVDSYQILDRPKPTSGQAPAAIQDYPRLLGRVLLGQEIAILESVDDGRLDELTNWLTDLAGTALPPAQPKTKVLNKVARSSIALRPMLWMPDGTEPEREAELERELQLDMTERIWPETPLPELGRRTPLEAGRDPSPAARVALRAALLKIDVGYQAWRDGFDILPLRERLGVPEEPEIPPKSLDLETIHLSRLHLVPAERLDDETLLRVYELAEAASLPLALDRASRAVVARPRLLESSRIDRVGIYVELANLALARGDNDEATSWLRQGRESDPEARRANAVQWDMADLRIRVRLEPPEAWVPELAVILESTANNTDAGSIVLRGLIELGIVRMVPNPEDPSTFLLDSRILQALLAEYGPRITTASGGLGISASRGAIWTPGSEAAAPGGATTSGGIWTPGAPTQPPTTEKKPTLFIPGR